MKGVSALFQGRSLCNANLTDPGVIPKNAEITFKFAGRDTPTLAVPPAPDPVSLFPESSCHAPTPRPEKLSKRLFQNRRRRENWPGRVVSARRRPLSGRSLKIHFPPFCPAPAYPGRGEFRCEGRNKRWCKN